jgi:DoxX-like family
MKASASVWVGRVLSGLFALFILGASAAPKLMGVPITDEIMTGLGWDTRWILPIGILELALTLLYIYRPTSVLGAVLFMGLLGGAMATNLRADQPVFSHTLFSVYLGLIMWGGLWLRDEKLRAVFPWRHKDA